MSQNKPSDNTKVNHVDTNIKQGKTKFRKVIAEGICMYAKVHAPAKPYSEDDIPQYTIDVLVDEDNAAKLKSEGLKVARKKVTKGDVESLVPKVYEEHPELKVFTFRRKTVRRDGKELKPLIVVDSNLTTIPPDILIGNGSKVRVSVNPFETVDKKGKPTTGHNLMVVQVLDLVPYTGANVLEGLEKSEGFTVPNVAKALTESLLDDQDNDLDVFED